MIVMLDPGATHNFISLTTVQKLGIPVSNTKGFGVSLGNGVAIQGTWECKGLLLQLEGVDVVEDFLPFELGNSDMILGVQWLEKLGSVTTNWKSQVMKFNVGRKTVMLKGDPTLIVRGSHLKPC